MGSAPIVVSGNGTPGAPFSVGVSYNGETGCAGIAACVGDHLGAGLTFDEATGNIQALVSRDPGNALTFGSDDGLFATGGGGGGGGAVCQRSVGSLPVAPGVVGAVSMAGLMGPFNSPYQLDYCVANGVDLIHFVCCATSDGVGYISEYNSGDVSSGRSSIYETQYARYLDSAAVQSTVNWCGDPRDPFAGESITNHAPTCGWYGWLSPQYQNWLLPSLLARLAGKAVALIDCHDVGETTNIEADNVQAALRGVRDYCAQQWSMIGVQLLANATTVINAGVEPIMMVDFPALYGTTTLPYTVAALTAAGVGWISLPFYYADSVFTTYINAGFKVLMYGASRHVHRTRMTTLGARGFLSLDPVYTRGPSVRDYRRTSDPISHRRMGNGQLSHLTDQTSVTGNLPRGYHRHPVAPAQIADEGLFLPARWGNGGNSPNLLVGWECPLQVPTAYTVSYEMMFDTLPTGTSGIVGLLFGMATDVSMFGWQGSDGNPQAMPTTLRNCYRVYQRVNGTLGVGIFSAAGAYTDLQTLASPAPAADVYNTYLLTVTPTTITFRRTTTNGTNYTVTATNNTWRGPYFALEKEEAHPENSQYGFIAGFRNLVVTGQGDV